MDSFKFYLNIKKTNNDINYYELEKEYVYFGPNFMVITDIYYWSFIV